MKAICIRSDEPERPLDWIDWPDPVQGPNEVLVDVYATSVNHADLSQRAGNYPPPAGAPDILGLDAAGRIVALGSDVEGWRAGDRVCALLPGGGYAEALLSCHRVCSCACLRTGALSKRRAA